MDKANRNGMMSESKNGKSINKIVLIIVRRFDMKRFNKAVAMILVLTFLGMTCGFEVAMAQTIYPTYKPTYDAAVKLNYPDATPNNPGLTPKVQNAGTAVVDKTTGAVKGVGTGIKNFWNKITHQSTPVTTTPVATTPVGDAAASSTTTAPAGTVGETSAATTADTAAPAQKTSFWNKFRSAVGSGAHKLGSAIEPAKPADGTATSQNAQPAGQAGAAPVQVEVSKEAATAALVKDGAISIDKNGKAHWTAGSEKKGFVSNADLDKMVDQKQTQIQKQAELTSTATADGAQSAITKAEAMDRLGIVKKGNNYYVDKPVAKSTVDTIVKAKMTEAGCTEADAMKRLGITQDEGGNFKVSRAVKGSTVDEMVAEKMAQNPVADQGDAAATENKPSKFGKFKTDLKDGYSSGMTNAKGIVKGTLDFRGGAAWQSLGLAAGLTVGVNLLSDVANGRPVDIKKAVGSVFRREFAGAYVGGALGAAGGALAQGVFSAIPVVGPIIGAFMPALGGIVGGQLGASLMGQTRDGKFSLKDALKTIDPVQVTGQAIGSTIGAMLGSLIPIPVVGTILGGMVGGYLGGKAATFIAGLFGRKPKDTTGGVVGRSPDTGGSTSTVDPGSFSAREAQKAYQDYIASYNRLTDLMTAGKGDTPEAQDAYKEYKASKEKYESLTNAMRK